MGYWGLSQDKAAFCLYHTPLTDPHFIRRGGNLLLTFLCLSIGLSSGSSSSFLCPFDSSFIILRVYSYYNTKLFHAPLCISSVLAMKLTISLRGSGSICGKCYFSRINFFLCLHVCVHACYCTRMEVRITYRISSILAYHVGPGD